MILTSLYVIKKGVYPYEYMGSWERRDETSFPEKKHFMVNYI